MLFYIIFAKRSGEAKTEEEDVFRAKRFPLWQETVISTCTMGKPTEAKPKAPAAVIPPPVNELNRVRAECETRRRPRRPRPTPPRSTRSTRAITPQHTNVSYVFFRVEIFETRETISILPQPERALTPAIRHHAPLLTQFLPTHTPPRARTSPPSRVWFDRSSTCSSPPRTTQFARRRAPC